jgi:hypothetical protein
VSRPGSVLVQARAAPHTAQARPAAARLAGALLAREFGIPLFAAIIVCAAAGWLAATTVTGIAESDGMSRLVLRLLRRFDLTLLAVAAVIAGMRVAVRLDEDRRTGWLEPYCAAGGSRAAYGVAIILAAALPAWMMFTAGAISFGTGILLLAESNELLRASISVIPAGLLFVAVAAAHVAAAAFIVREPLAALVCAALVGAAPHVAAAVFLMRNEFAPAPLQLRVWMQAAPPLTVAATAPELLRQMLYAATMTGFVALASRYATGRRT